MEIYNGDPVIVRKDYTDINFTPGKGVLIVFMSIMNVFMFLGNTLSIVTITSTPKLRQQVSYWFVLNLAVIDLLISLTVVPLNTMWEYYGIWPLSKPTCQFFTFADTSFSTISAYSIALVSIDKYIYVTYAIHYQDRMTRKTAVVLISSVWVLVFAFTTWLIVSDMGTKENFKDHFLKLDNGTQTCIYTLTDDYVIPTAILSFFLPLFVLCFTSSRIICIASRHLRTINALEKSASSGSYSYTEKNTTVSKPRRATFNTPSPSCYQSTASTMYEVNQTKQNETDHSFSDNDKAVNHYEKSDISNQSDNDKGIPNPRPNTDLQVASSSKMKKCEGKHYLKNILECFKANHLHLPNIKCDEATSSDTRTDTGPSVSTDKSQISDRTLSTRTLSLRKASDSRGRRRHFRRYCKLFGTVTIVILCFVAMFAPFNIAIMVDVTCHCIEPWVYEDILAVLYYMHSLVNPYIYMATDRKYKAALKIVWSRIRRKRVGSQQFQ